MSQQLNRRALFGVGVLAGAAAACSSSTPPSPPQPAPSFDPRDWASVRAQFALRRDVAHFAAFTLAPAPAPVRAEIAKHRDGLDADPDYAPVRDQDPDQPVREAAARFLGGRPEDVALTDSTTMGLGLIYSGLRLRPGQDVLTTEHDFLATHEGLRLLAARTGARVRKVRLYDDPAKATADRMVSTIKAALGPRTRVVAITWVHSSTGVRLPVRQIAAMLADVNARRDEHDRVLLCVDGVHGFAAVADKVTDLGCDFLASGTHKWLFGPRGTGVLWGRAWDALSPVIAGFGQKSFEIWQLGTPPGPTTAELATPGGFKAFEHRWAMPSAFAFQEAIGPDRVQQRVQELAGRLKAGLAGIKHVTLATPMDPALSAGLVCCSITGMEPLQAVDALRRSKVVAGTTPYNGTLLRFGTTIVNTPEQVDQAVKAVAMLV
ncbi:aminotransferase class V-fold PLP-dependent enzyme [Nonomuraea sp. NPDC001831]|uniref:aminotransferase class V-fold PLP-dependent enzyme n=1 Tax=Nonomuraea sp. NPDC001831 TaxID=3364340 RepID=UPI0036C60823